MYDEGKLSSKQRGYKQAGCKLKPRSSWDSMSKEQAQVHSMRELHRACAAELAAYGYRPESEPHVRRMEKAMARLSPSAQRAVYRMLDANAGSEGLPRNMRRAYDAAIECDQIERCIQWDANTLANAY